MLLTLKKNFIQIMQHLRAGDQFVARTVPVARKVTTLYTPPNASCYGEVS